ncbi:MAG: hypothetical protein JJ992_05540, partial [Planctomycetes bacterium]|nr:hypothetical protein [Planctomycetota bacterium]
FDVASGQEHKVMADNLQGVQFLAYSPDGRWLVSLSHTGSLSLWDVTSGAQKAIASESSPFFGLGFSEDGKRIMLGARSQIKVLDATTLRAGLVLQAPGNMARSGISTSSYLTACCWSVDGAMLAGAWGQPIPIWNLRSGGKR